MKKKIAFAMIMGIVTTCIVSFSLIAINIGFPDNFLQIWIKSWMIAYVVAIPAILVIAPQIEKLVNRFFRDEVPTKNQIETE